MKILHVTQVTESGGLVNVLMNLLRDQAARGWEVHLACPDDGGELFPAGRDVPGVVVHRWSAVRSPTRGVLTEARSLRRIVRRVSPDLVHLHSSKAGLSGRLAVRGQVPTVFQPHAWSFEAVKGPPRRAALAWERFATRWTTGTLCVSDGEARTGAALRALAPRSVTIYNGVDTDLWVPGDRAAARRSLGIDPGAPVVVSVGRLVPQKGQDVAIAAWPRVTAVAPGASLYLVGDGPTRAQLEAMSGSGVHFVGLADPKPWYAAADLVLVPSRWEGMPLVILEAMACGRAVVSADVAGAREALAAAGPVVPVDDVDALGAAVAARLLDPADLAARGQELRVRAVEFFDRAASCAGVADFEMRCAGLPVPHAPRPAPELIRDAAAPATQGAVTRLSSRKP